jgi:hypothetical protein
MTTGVVLTMFIFSPRAELTAAFNAQQKVALSGDLLPVPRGNEQALFDLSV